MHIPISRQPGVASYSRLTEWIRIWLYAEFFETVENGPSTAAHSEELRRAIKITDDAIKERVCVVWQAAIDESAAAGKRITQSFFKKFLADDHVRGAEFAAGADTEPADGVDAEQAEASDGASCAADEANAAEDVQDYVQLRNTYAAARALFLAAILHQKIERTSINTD